MTKCKHVLNWNSSLDFFKWTHISKWCTNTCQPDLGNLIKNDKLLEACHVWYQLSTRFTIKLI